MKKLLVLLFITCTLTACGNKAPAADIPSDTTVTPSVEETVADTPVTETPSVAPKEEITDSAPVAPLPVSIDMNALDDCTLAVSFDKDGFYTDDTGTVQMKVKVYTYDLYDLVDISQLEVGKEIILRGQVVTVDSLETTERGNVLINGGLDAQGYELITNEDGVYFETGYSDLKAYYELGEAVLPVSDDFLFTDKSDLENEPVTYGADAFLREDTEFFYYFIPDNTTIVISGGEVVSMERIYTP